MFCFYSGKQSKVYSDTMGLIYGEFAGLLILQISVSVHPVCIQTLCHFFFATVKQLNVLVVIMHYDVLVGTKRA